MDDQFFIAGVQLYIYIYTQLYNIDIKFTDKKMIC